MDDGMVIDLGDRRAVVFNGRANGHSKPQFSYTIVVQYYYNNERHAVIRFQHNFNG